ncbi:MAG: S8 family serine peptidase [Actinomycetota bacterium]
MRRLAVLTLVLLAGTMLPIATAAAAGSPMDRNGNKIFDDLDDALQGRSSDALVDVIVAFSEGESSHEAAQAQRGLGAFKIRYEYQTISGVAARMSIGQIRSIAQRSDTAHVQLDAPVHTMLDTSRASFGVPKATADFGVDGNNGTGACPGVRDYCGDDVVVAVIDTGIDAAHSDLGDPGAQKVIGFADCVDATCATVAPFDDHGHGTHVASTIAGDGDGSVSRSLHGVAPGAGLVGVKVLSGSGSGSTSGVDAGVEWTILNKNLYGIDTLNMSLGGSGSSDGTDSTSRVVNRAVAGGITAFVAGGNSGPGRFTTSSPAAAEHAITVCAMADPNDADGTRVPGWGLASFSSRGPTRDNRIKPDICAAGVDVMAADAGTGNGYVSMSGTSMATPFAAGVGALMLDANPALAPSGTVCPAEDTTTDCKDGVYDASMNVPVKTGMAATAEEWGPAGKDIDFGWGRVQAYEAVDWGSALAGTAGPAQPTHTFTSGSLSGTNDIDWYTIPVTSTDSPIAVTFVMTSYVNWFESDFDIFLYRPNGTEAQRSWDNLRQETLGFMPNVTGDWQLKVHSWAGSGPYWFDLSYPGGTVVPNIAPTAETGSAGTNEDTGVAITLAGTDAETCELSFSVVDGPAHGSLTSPSAQACTAGSPNTDTAGVTYTPSANYTGSDSFTYRVNDGSTDSNTATVTLAVTPANDPPAANFTYSCTMLACSFTDTSSDVDGDAIVSWAWTFGDGAGDTSQSPAHTFSAAGTYLVGLMVGDGLLQSATTVKSVTVSKTVPWNLTATGFKLKKTRTVTLAWDTAASSAAVDVWRNGTRIATGTPNDGDFVNSLSRGGTYTYKVCVTGTNNCSNEASATV